MAYRITTSETFQVQKLFPQGFIMNPEKREMLEKMFHNLICYDLLHIAHNQVK
jgi:hypothetical protein